MKSLFFNCVGLWSFVAASLSLGGVLVQPACGQECPITFPGGSQLTSFITIYPGYNTHYSSDPAVTLQQQLISYFLVDVTNPVNHTNYPNPPIPYGLYPTWCVDQWDFIDPPYITVPGSIYTGTLYSTCDPLLNTYLLPLGHPFTVVPPATWQMVNYILNNHTYGGSNAFYWDIQAAINTLVGSGVGFNECGTPLTTPIPDGVCGYPSYHPNAVYTLLNAASNAVLINNWVPQCGDVYGVIYVTDPTTDQLLLLEVPIHLSVSPRPAAIWAAIPPPLRRTPACKRPRWSTCRVLQLPHLTSRIQAPPLRNA